MGETIRINVSLPKTVLEELRRFVAPRKRSEFMVEAAKEKLAIIKQQRALEEAAGVWADEAHQDLNTPEDMDMYLSDVRGSYHARLERMLGE